MSRALDGAEDVGAMAALSVVEEAGLLLLHWRRRKATQMLPPSWLGSHPVSAGSTGSWARRPTADARPVPGSETRSPGSSQRHRPRVFGPHRGPVVRKTFFN